MEDYIRKMATISAMATGHDDEKNTGDKTLEYVIAALEDCTRFDEEEHIDPTDKESLKHYERGDVIAALDDYVKIMAMVAAVATGHDDEKITGDGAPEYVVVALEDYVRYYKEEHVDQTDKES